MLDQTPVPIPIVLMRTRNRAIDITSIETDLNKSEDTPEGNQIVVKCFIGSQDETAVYEKRDQCILVPVTIYVPKAWDN